MRLTDVVPVEVICPSCHATCRTVAYPEDWDRETFTVCAYCNAFIPTMYVVAM